MGTRDDRINELQAEITRLRGESEQDYSDTMKKIETANAEGREWGARMITKAEITLTIDGKKEKLIAEGFWKLDDLPRMTRYLGNCIDNTIKRLYPRPSGPTVLEMTNDLRRRITKIDNNIAKAYARIAQYRAGE
jgi:hypothetical protein